jgi:thiol-disulfide isomerase/thioredoxin
LQSAVTANAPGELSVSWFFDYQYFNRAQSGGKAAANPKNEQTMVRSSFLNLGYQLNRRWSLTALLPFRAVTAPKDIRPNERVTRSFSGLGDLMVLGNYQLNQPERPTRPTVALQFGLRLPTGKAQPDHTFLGSLSRDPVLQTGHGTFDPLLGVSCFQTLKGTTLSANALARLTSGKNRYGVKFSHELQGGFGIARQFSAPRPLAAALSGVQLGLRLHGIKSGHDYDLGQPVANTGGRWLYLLPSLIVQTKSSFSYFFQFQLPLYQRVNGAQLVAPYAFTTGVSFTPFRRKEGRESAAQSEPAGLPTAFEPEVISRGEQVELQNHLAAGRVTVFEFYADWCFVCRRLDPALKRLAVTRSDLVLKRINIGDGETEVSKQYGIAATPTFYVHGTDGSLFKTFVTDDLQKLEVAIKAASANQPPASKK